MIKFSDKTQAIWFVTLPTGDWLAHIESIDGGRFKVMYRFRYVVDDKVWDSDDIKNWYACESTDLQRSIDAMRASAGILTIKGGGENWELLRGTGSFEDFIDQFKALPFVKTKIVRAQ